ncbi:hypothetical protein [Methanolobus sp. WCC4]|uniref:hypothetical protein n=1 Tax=Methanolobus sp. WCC4 TaxID=3125784 RepID=UPI0030F5CB56
MLCHDCRRSVDVFPGDEVVECDCGAEYNVIREDDNVSLRRTPWHRERPSSESKISYFGDIRTLECVICKGELSVPFRAGTVTCECGAAYDCKISPDGSLSLWQNSCRCSDYAPECNLGEVEA